MSDRKRILVGVPCYNGVSPEVLEDFGRFMFYLGRRLPQYDFFLVVKSKSEQFRARNLIVQGAQQVNADYVLMLDDDMVVNHFGDVNASADYGFIEKLVEHDKDIVGALYYQRQGGCLPVAMVEQGEGYRFLQPHEITGKLQKVDVVGGGAMLVKMRVFDRLPFPHFAPEFDFGTDVQLCRAAKDAGMEVWLDGSIELGHVRDERVVVTSRNRNQFAMSDSAPGEVKRQMVQADIFNTLLDDAKEWTGYKTIEDMAVAGQKFMTRANKEWTEELGANWYASYPKERVARQVWFNMCNDHKRQMTEFILGTINDSIKARILDFGCGIGIPAYELAKRGHDVTACDLSTTGTFAFLQWRAEKHKVPMRFEAADGTGYKRLYEGSHFGAIIAMDCLEHMVDWRDRLAMLANALAPGGMLFSNNGILDDQVHPEHIGLNPKDFMRACIELDLVPYSPISFMKRERPQDLSVTS